MPARLVCFYYIRGMQKIKLIHNPTAGNGAYSKKELTDIIKSAGYECDYYSSKKEGWKEIEEGTDMIIIAGGDGTVRKLTKAFLKDDNLDSDIPVGLLNLGTANNLVRTLRIKGEPGELIETYRKERVRKFDTGIIKGLEESQFFLESCGFGVFPALMNEMRKNDVHDIDAALQAMVEIIKSAKPFRCKINADDKETEDSYLLVEVMNSAWMGPSLHMNAISDPGDGKFELVAIKEEERDSFIEFIKGNMADGSGAFSHHPLQFEKLSIVADTQLFHADDDLIKIKANTPVKVRMRKEFLKFMIP
jgi:diacylglycerol kinase (ATP)